MKYPAGWNVVLVVLLIWVVSAGLSCSELEKAISDKLVLSDKLASMGSISSRGGKLCATNGLCVQAPAGAVDKGVKILARIVKKLPTASISPEKSGGSLIGQAFELKTSVEHLQFNKLLKLTLPLEQADRSKKITAAFLNEKGLRSYWQQAVTQKSDDGKSLVALTSHFSIWSVVKCKDDNCKNTCLMDEVTTLAGSRVGHRDGQGMEARFNRPIGITLDASGNIYVTEQNNHMIRKITPSGKVTTLFGTEKGYRDDFGTYARFNHPTGIAIDAYGNIFVADEDNHLIRKITPKGMVTTFAGSSPGHRDGVGTDAQLDTPWGLKIGPKGNLFVTEFYSHKIRKVTPSGKVTTLAGSEVGLKDGTGKDAQFHSPWDLAIDQKGNVYVADTNNHRIRKITPDGKVTTFAGSSQGYRDAVGKEAQFNGPAGIAIDSSGNLFVADYNNHKVRKVTPSGKVTTVVGGAQGYKDGDGMGALFRKPIGIAVDASGNLYVTDDFSKIRKISPSSSPSLASCNGTCVNTATDASHCGGCGKACKRGQVCQLGKCSCPDGKCAPDEVGKEYAAERVPGQEMVPEVAPPDAGQPDLSNTDSIPSPEKTSDAGQPDLSGTEKLPSPEKTSDAGQPDLSGTEKLPSPDKTSDAGQPDLSGTEKLPSPDVKRAEMTSPDAGSGSPETVSDNPDSSRVGDTAGPQSCSSGKTDCSGSCKDLQTDKSNCGKCGMSCSVTCQKGRCTCAAGQKDCNGTCIPVKSCCKDSDCSTKEKCLKGRCMGSGGPE